MSPTNLGALASNSPLPTGEFTYITHDGDESWAAWPAANTPFNVKLGGSALTLLVNRPRRHFWSVHAYLIYIGNVWGRCDVGIQISPADLYGITTGVQAIATSSSEVPWQTLHLKALFYCEASTLYTARLVSLGTDGQSQYYRAHRHLFLFGHTMGEGFY